MWGGVMRPLIRRSLPRPYRTGVKRCGSSLIEVMLAVAVMAVTALGLIAGQLWTAREARAMSMREHAAWIADSVAEAMSAPTANDAALNAWRSRAATQLPGGDASVIGIGGVSAARVTWTTPRNAPHAADDVIDKPEPCGGVDAPVGLSCVALPFVK
jgi:Tfp pilus assembly protein PilV